MDEHKQRMVLSGIIRLTSRPCASAHCLSLRNYHDQGSRFDEMTFSILHLSNPLSDVCDARTDPAFLPTVLALTLCTSTLAFLSGYYSRDVGTSKSTNSSLSRVISHITQVARDQYSTFAELCEGLDSVNNIDGSEVSSDDEEPDTVEDKEEEKDVETPKAVRQEAVGPFSNILPSTMPNTLLSYAPTDRLLCPNDVSPPPIQCVFNHPILPTSTTVNSSPCLLLLPNILSRFSLLPTVISEPVYTFLTTCPKSSGLPRRDGLQVG
ncbi:hypothetical protein BC629DRAFT_1077942 [Irpex lacteus]|nr:hypothetical protein BC629DRAFT_1077942 [Irpex lacteus]